MRTSFGLYLRRLRIQRNEVLQNMADKLGISKAFLSAMETGKKHIPKRWAAEIVALYGLDQRQEDELAFALAQTNNKIELNLQDVPEENKMLAFSFSKKFAKLDEKTINEMKKLIEGDQ